MKAPFRLSFLFAALVVVAPSSAFAAEPVEAGIDDDAAVDDALGNRAVADDGAASDDASSEDESNTDPTGGSNDTPLRCDGALCDTTTGATTCNMARSVGARGPAPLVPALVLLVATSLVLSRRRSRRAEERTR